MKAYIGGRIVDAAAAAFRGIASASNAIVPWKGRPPATTGAAGPPFVLEISLIRIEIHLIR